MSVAPWSFPYLASEKDGFLDAGVPAFPPVDAGVDAAPPIDRTRTAHESGTVRKFSETVRNFIIFLPSQIAEPKGPNGWGQGVIRTTL